MIAYAPHAQHPVTPLPCTDQMEETNMLVSFLEDTGKARWMKLPKFRRWNKSPFQSTGQRCTTQPPHLTGTEMPCTLKNYLVDQRPVGQASKHRVRTGPWKALNLIGPNSRPWNPWILQSSLEKSGIELWSIKYVSMIKYDVIKTAWINFSNSLEILNYKYPDV